MQQHNWLSFGPRQVTPPESFLDDVVTLMTLTYVSCEFDGGARCEAKFVVDAAHGYEGELRIRVAPHDADLLKSGDVYSMHIRRL